MEIYEHKLRSICFLQRPVFEWACTFCTFINKSYWDECEICDSYRIFGTHEPLRIERPKKSMRKLK